MCREIRVPCNWMANESNAVNENGCEIDSCWSDVLVSQDHRRKCQVNIVFLHKQTKWKFAISVCASETGHDSGSYEGPLPDHRRCN